jgi:hypothetical protein
MLTSCPQRLITPETMDALRAASFANKGFLPYDGGYMSQPHYLMSAVDYIWHCESLAGSPSTPTE